MEENQKRTSGGRSDNRRSNNSRTRREGNAPQPANRGSNAQPKFDPHFVSAPEATPLRPVKKKAPAAQPAAKQTTPAQNGQRQRGSQPAVPSSAPTAMIRAPSSGQPGTAAMPSPAQNGQSQQGSRNNRNEQCRAGRPARARQERGTPQPQPQNTAPARRTRTRA